MGKGGGGGGGQPTQQTVTQTNLPEYAKPYFENIMSRAQAESYRPYQAYSGERIAAFNPAQIAAQTEVKNLQTPSEFAAASNLATQAGQRALQAGQYQPAQFTSPMVQAAALQQFQASGPSQISKGIGSFTDTGTIEQFMSPYMQNVVDVQRAQAIRAAQQGQLAQNLAAARTGSYGGARQLLATTERERGLGQQLAQIQAQGSQAAYDAAQKAFEAEQGRNLQAALQTQQLGTQTGLENLRALLGVQQLGSQQGLEAQRLNQQALMDAQRMAEQSRQYGAGLGLQGAQAATQTAQTLGSLGTSRQASTLQRIQAQAAAAAEQRQLQQQRLDQQYADFMRQRDYPLEMIGYYSNILRGIPVGLGSTATTYAQPPSLASQAAGLGLAGLGLYNLGRG